MSRIAYRARGQRNLCLGKRQVEALAQCAAADFHGFYEARKRATGAGDALVISCDGKGVVMRHDALRAATRRQAQSTKSKLKTRLSKGGKRNRKRVAEVAAIYDITPTARTAADILPADDAQRDGARAAPAAKNKWLTASVTQDAATVVAALFDEADRRDPPMTATGSPWSTPTTTRSTASTPKPRRAAHRWRSSAISSTSWSTSGRPPGASTARATPPPNRGSAATPNRSSPANATRVAGQIRRQPTNAALDPPARAGTDKCAAYLTNKQAYLNYPTALQKGWPIATGVIEGACRHLVNDRMDITGARWGLHGTETILKLRAIHSNGDFDEYWTYHLAQERQRVHDSRYADHAIPRPA